MPGWTWEDVTRRNREIFGEPLCEQPTFSSLDPKILESEIELECCQLLAEDGWRTLKTDPVSNRSRAKGFGEPGMADTLAIRYGAPPAAQLLWIEWKRPGSRAKKHQIAWHTKEQARGALTIIAGVNFAPTVEGFQGWYRASGLARRRELGESECHPVPKSI